ncbi:protein TolQ [Blochmannia endosymbiont of Polyrhachis (Hedomyrma) turneri]|uniref:protein TolQ n=1 Tax=Blochmannia endosymbiont of Polyrhachis (Hedomyrma) turneri TaxID=1505596 RepID=UPI00061A8059|nr:protein TolQ [Blochmannia endosymbiont of Polyrhachis (Hedomyrma) turneri]AKC59904.1 Protein tolQ [Blochmannia endosymbiont of Polyrhachis (Hedomyrma) turneri]
MDFLEMFLKSSLLIQVIMLILISCSVFSWGIIIYQIHVLNTINRSIRKFENKFNSGKSLDELYQHNVSNFTILTGPEIIFYSGFKEFSRLCHDNNFPLKDILKATMQTMRATVYTELQKLEKHVFFLGIIGSISPYIGLFGTILSIIHIFFKLGSVKYITLQTIAPGVAESLIFTAIGLFVAIPSVIAFHHSNLCINNIEQKYEIFLNQFTSILQKKYFSKKIN